MSLNRLLISNLRNLTAVDIKPASDLNIIYGDNGSGKSSLLEAIHIICRGQSFRSNSIRPVIQSDHKITTLFTELESNEQIIPIGVERLLNGGGRIRIAGKNINTLAELLALLPVQFIGPDLQKVLEQGPKSRRNLLDWGVFHVEHNFYPTWMRYNKLLKQRNAALRQHANKDVVTCWDHQLISYATSLTQLRERYIENISPSLSKIIAGLLKIDGLDFIFNQGWPGDESLQQVIDKSYQSDCKRGFTQFGPHRADLIFRVFEKPAVDKLSRGQLKLLVIAFKLAQVELLNQVRSDQQCVFLMDDLPAELDSTNRAIVLNKLLESNVQLFVTATDSALIDITSIDSKKKRKMFHVEHGLVTEVI